MKPTDQRFAVANQIAAEAADRIADLCESHPSFTKEIKREVQSAIEKATRDKDDALQQFSKNNSDLNKQILRLNRERAAHGTSAVSDASKQGVDDALRNARKALIKARFTTDSEIIQQIDAALSRRPTPATASETREDRFTRKMFGFSKPRNPGSASVGKRHELLERIQDYLAKGGLFNPELMEADKVQQLIMDCRTYIVQHERVATPSGGGEWIQLMKAAEGVLATRYLGNQSEETETVLDELQMAVSEAHNATLQPRDESVRNMELLRRIDELEALQPRDK